MVLVVATSAVVVGVVIPSALRIRALGSEIATTEEFLELQYQRAQQRQRSVRELATVYAATADYERAAVSPQSELALITTFEDLAAVYGLETNFDITYTEQRRQHLAGYYTFQTLNHGPFIQQLQFLQALEQLPYYVHISSMSLTSRPQGAQDAASDVSMRFTATIYVAQD